MRISDWSSDVCSSDLELDLGHAQKGAADTVPGIVRHAVVEHRAAVAAQLDRALGAVLMKAVALQGDHRVGMRQLGHALRIQIGRASCRERVCQYVSISVVAGSFKKKKKKKNTK